MKRFWTLGLAGAWLFAACGGDDSSPRADAGSDVTGPGDAADTGSDASAADADATLDAAVDATADVDASVDADVDGDATADAEIEPIDANDGATAEEKFATLTFEIDDSANKTYDGSDGLAWKGSFSYDDKTNTLTHDPAWGGPFVMLYDDGPSSVGGHEAEGAIAGDSIWSVAVKLAKPSADKHFEYGAIRGSVDGADGHWIWSGPNGTFSVPAGATGIISAPGLTIAAHGTIDWRLTLDLSKSGQKLAPTFQGVSYQQVAVKSSHLGWSVSTLVDDGTKGDPIAGDDVFTFVLSESLGKHDGLLRAGDEPEFVFVLDMVEYKESGVASAAGATAAIQTAKDVWTEVPIQSKPLGDQNTFIQVPLVAP